MQARVQEFQCITGFDEIVLPMISILILKLIYGDFDNLKGISQNKHVKLRSNS